jgi:hypothetical protein
VWGSNPTLTLFGLRFGWALGFERLALLVALGTNPTLSATHLQRHGSLALTYLNAWFRGNLTGHPTVQALRQLSKLTDFRAGRLSRKRHLRPLIELDQSRPLCDYKWS